MNAVLKTNESRILGVEGLTVDFDVKGKSVNILSEISFDLNSGETLGIIGESGSGKSMTALALLRMIPSPPDRITAGKVLLNDENLLTATKNRINSILSFFFIFTNKNTFSCS